MRRLRARPQVDALIRLVAAAVEAVRRRVDISAPVRPHSQLVFEGTVVLLKEVAPPGPDGTREVVATFRVQQSASVPGPKFVVAQTTLRASHPLQLGASYLVRAAVEDASPAGELAGCTVRSLRDARLELTQVGSCATAAA
jgi:hypothetical protein